jgi:hypothetical protein
MSHSESVATTTITRPLAQIFAIMNLSRRLTRL